MSYIHPYDKAVDVVNDGFIKTFRNLHRFECEEQSESERRFKGWLKRIMINNSIDQLRKRNEDSRMISIPDGEVEFEDRSPSPDERLWIRDIQLLVDKLPPASRAVFNLVAISGMTHKEVASKLGISESTSKSNFSRARSHLQKHLLSHY